ncbi:MAG: YpmA family protein [Clostridia bacterium]|nr:YpmA family protein [Clostridia bacterium]
MDEKNQGKLQLIATKTVKSYDELYIIVDFLNKTLKEHRVMFGLTKDVENGTMTISVYEV